MVRAVIAALLFAAARPASAAPALSFEQSLGQLHQQLSALRASQVRQKADGLAQRIDRVAMDASRYYWDSDNLRRILRDLRWRAQRLQHPNQDPWFRSDLDRFIWDLKDLARNVEWARAEAQDITNLASKNPALVAPAQDLSNQAQSLRSETSWLESDGRWAADDFRRLGLQFEAWDVERESRDAMESSRRLDDQARALLAKVR